jgi:hypothetical protein
MIGIIASPSRHLQHVEGRQNRPLGVVLVRDRGPKESHDRIPDVLVDVSFVSVDDVGQLAQQPMHDEADLFRVETLGQRSEAGQVREQHDDLAPITPKLLAGTLVLCS